MLKKFYSGLRLILHWIFFYSRKKRRDDHICLVGSNIIVKTLRDKKYPVLYPVLKRSIWWPKRRWRNEIEEEFWRTGKYLQRREKKKKEMNILEDTRNTSAHSDFTIIILVSQQMWIIQFFITVHIP